MITIVDAQSPISHSPKFVPRAWTAWSDLICADHLKSFPMICARDSKLFDFAESIVHFTLCSSQLMLGWILHGNVHMFNVYKNVCWKLLMMMLGHYGNHAGEICAFAHASREILKKRFFCCCFEYHLMDSFTNVIIWADGKMYVHSFIRLVLGWKSAWKSTENLKIRDPLNKVFSLTANNQTSWKYAINHSNLIRFDDSSG